MYEEKESSEESAETTDAKKLSEYSYQKRVKVVEVEVEQDGKLVKVPQIEYIDTDTEKDDDEIVNSYLLT